MNRQEYNLMVKDWNNFLLTEERILSEQKILLEKIINEGKFLEKLRNLGVKRSIAIPLLFVKMLSLYPDQGYAEAPTHEKVAAAAVSHGYKMTADEVKGALAAPEAKKAIEALHLKVQELDSDGNPVDEPVSGGSAEISGLSVVQTGSYVPEPQSSGWKILHDSSKKIKAIENLKNLAQEDIDKASEKAGIKSLAYGMQYLHTTNMVKFDAKIKEMNKFIAKYQGSRSFKAAKKVSMFIKNSPDNNDVELLDAAFAFAAIKTCSELPDKCSTFKDGYERSTTQARYSGNVKSDEKKTAFSGVGEESDVFAMEAGKVFKRNLYMASNTLYAMKTQLKEAKKNGEDLENWSLNLSEIENGGLVTGVLHGLLTDDGEMSDGKLETLFNKISETGNEFFESGQTETGVDGETRVAGAGSNKTVDTDDIVKKQSDFLDDQLNNESLLEIFNIV